MVKWTTKQLITASLNSCLMKLETWYPSGWLAREARRGSVLLLFLLLRALCLFFPCCKSFPGKLRELKLLLIWLLTLQMNNLFPLPLTKQMAHRVLGYAFLFPLPDPFYFIITSINRSTDTSRSTEKQMIYVIEFVLNQTHAEPCRGLTCHCCMNYFSLHVTKVGIKHRNTLPDAFAKRKKGGYLV